MGDATDDIVARLTQTAGQGKFSQIGARKIMREAATLITSLREALELAENKFAFVAAIEGLPLNAKYFARGAQKFCADALNPSRKETGHG